MRPMGKASRDQSAQIITVSVTHEPEEPLEGHVSVALTDDDQGERVGDFRGVKH